MEEWDSRRTLGGGGRGGRRERGREREREREREDSEEDNEEKREHGRGERKEYLSVSLAVGQSQHTPTEVSFQPARDEATPPFPL